MRAKSKSEEAAARRESISFGPWRDIRNTVRDFELSNHG
jgi:hypothetical protein